MNCPRCQSSLVRKNYEGVETDQCSSCNGSWLDEGELTKIIDAREKIFGHNEVKKTLQQRTFKLQEFQNESRLPCPKCMKMMKTFNYAGDSGIVLDRCMDNHGLWFDQGELDKVQMFREHWEKEAVERGDEWVALTRGVSNGKKFTLSPFQILMNFFFD